MRVYYAIKRPGRGHGWTRRGFAVTRTVVRDDGTRVNSTVQNPDIEAINAALANGHQDQEKSFLQVREIVRLLKEADRGPERRPVFSQENLDLVTRYWEEEYEHVRLADPKTLRYDLDRAVRACGTVSLASGSQRALQKAVNGAVRGRKQRRVVQRLNELLRWLGRDFRLDKDDEELRDIRYLTAEEMLVLSEHLRNDHERALVWTLFGTGTRFGEAFALSPERFSAERGIVHVVRQRREDWSIDDTKTGRHPKVPIIPLAAEYVAAWVALPADQKQALRNLKAREVVTAACREAFPGRPDKWVHFHDLRHSYAVHLARRGLSLARIARALGISEQVAARHYAGYVQTDEEVDEAVALLKRPAPAAG